MDAFLIAAYRFLSVLLFLVLSCVLIYHRLFRRWLKFSFGFFIVYLVGGYLFFGKLLVSEWLTQGTVETVIASAPYILFYVGTPMLLGLLLFRGHGFVSIVGATLLFLGALALMLVAITNSLGRPFGFVYELSPHARAWIEIASVLFLLVGSVAVVGYCLLGELTRRQTMGALLIFLVLAGVVMVLVQLTIGYQFLGRIRWQAATLFPLVST